MVRAGFVPWDFTYWRSILSMARKRGLWRESGRRLVFLDRNWEFLWDSREYVKERVVVMPLLSLWAPPVRLPTMVWYSQEGPHQSQYHVTWTFHLYNCGLEHINLFSSNSTQPWIFLYCNRKCTDTSGNVFFLFKRTQGSTSSSWKH